MKQGWIVPMRHWAGTVFLFGASLVATVTAAQETVRVGVYDFQPLCRSYPSVHGGETKAEGGLFVELLRGIAEEEGWDLRFVAGTLHECIERVMEGSLDLAVAVPHHIEDGGGIAMSKETIISTWARVYSTQKSDPQTIVDIEGRAVGVVRDDPYNHQLRDIAHRFNIQCRFVEFVNYDKVVEGLRRGWVDLGVVDRLYAVSQPGLGDLHLTPILFSPVALRFAAPPSRRDELIAALDYHVAALKQDPGSAYHRLINTVLSGADSQVFPVWLGWALGAGLGLLLFFGGVSLFLRYRVRVKTAELSRKNQALQKEIGRRAEAEENARNSEQLLRKTFAGMRDALLISDGGGRCVVECNEAAEQMLHYPRKELVGRELASLYGGTLDFAEFSRLVRTSAEKKGFFKGESRLVRKAGDAFPAEITITPLRDESYRIISWVTIARDASLREALRESEHRLRHAQKMEAIGTLAGGIAHDFNNILMPILGYAELLSRLIPNKDEALHNYVQQITKSGKRARDLASQILAFGRKRETGLNPLRLSPIVKEAMKLIRSSLPSTISIKIEIETENDLVAGDPTQVHQVLMNLCANAAHAMGERGGVLTVTLKDHRGPMPGWPADTELKDRRYVRLSVGDTGEGIRPAVLHRIFDPFFTTKDHVRGTGMGLAVVHGIVKSFDGAVSVENEPGRGAVFHIYLPESPREDETVSDAPEEQWARGNGERVLFVDDEYMIAEMAGDGLSGLGYRVVTETDGRAALALFKKQPHRFDAVITDQTMPGLTGGDLAKEMLIIRPRLPIVLCTGYSETMSRDRAKAIGISEYVPKPCDPVEMGRILRRVLDREVTESSPSVPCSAE